MNTPAWRDKLEADAQQVTHTTRLTSILLRRTLLHVWLSLKAVWRFGLLRGLLLLPLVILRALFFPLQWPLAMAGGGLRSAWRWINDEMLVSIGRAARAAINSPLQLVSGTAGAAWNWLSGVGRRCRSQYRELRELGFVNAMALMPFLIVRLVQGAVLTLLGAIKAIGRWCWRGLQAGGGYLLAVIASVAAFFSFSRAKRWLGSTAAATTNRVSSSRLVQGTRAVVPAVSRVGRSIVRPPVPTRAGWITLSRSFRQQAAWVLVTVAGTLGLLLLLYFQWTSLPPALAVSGNAGRGEVEPSGLLTATDPLPEPQAPFESHQTEPAPDTAADEPAWIETSPPAAADVSSTEPEPFPIAVERSIPEAGEDASFNPFGDEPLPAPAETNSPPAPIAPGEPSVAEESTPTMEPRPQLELSTGWFGPDAALDDPDNIVVVGASADDLKSADPASAFYEVDDDWGPLRSKPRPAALRPRFDRTPQPAPDGLPAEAGPAAIADDEVEPGGKQIDVTVTREVPDEAALFEQMSYRLIVYNRGGRRVDRVTVEENLPSGFRVVETSPAAARRESKLIWHLSGLKPNERRTLDVQVLPTEAGRLDAFATVRPTAAIVAATRVGRPAIELDVAAPRRVAAGRDCTVRFQVRNTSGRPMQAVILRALLSAGLSHPQGRSLDHEVPPLEPGESRDIWLTARADAIGEAQLDARLVSGTTTLQTSDAAIAITEPARAARPPRCRPRPAFAW